MTMPTAMDASGVTLCDTCDRLVAVRQALPGGMEIE
jgi:hypothetical protein